MDKFTRNYSIVLGVVLLALLAYALYEDPIVSDLNEKLAADAEVSAYPYAFRVVRFNKGIATMRTPRSFEFPVQRALGLLFPALANKPQDDPDLMKAQDELARVQKHAMAIVTSVDEVKRVSWELDKDWLMGHGVTISPN